MVQLDLELIKECFLFIHHVRNILPIIMQCLVEHLTVVTQTTHLSKPKFKDH
jgi:hypothetical protein